MKEALIAILQTRMDKCTSEQFWATGAIGALDAYLISQHDIMIRHLQGWAVLLFAGLAAAYGMYYVVHRHIAYYAMHSLFVELLTGEPNIPQGLTAKYHAWKGTSLNGVLFYLGVVLASTIGVFVTYL